MQQKELGQITKCAINSGTKRNFISRPWNDEVFKQLQAYDSSCPFYLENGMLHRRSLATTLNRLP